MGLDQSLAPDFQLESYDLGRLFDNIDAAGLLPDIPVVVLRRGAPSMGGDPIRTASRSPRPRSMRSVRRNGTRRPCGPQTFPAPR